MFRKTTIALFALILICSLQTTSAKEAIDHSSIIQASSTPAKIINPYDDFPIHGVSHNQPDRRPSRDIGETMEIGFTWYDYQHNGSISQMIVRDNAGGTHFAYMCGYNAQQNPRHVVYNFLSEDGELLVEPEGRGVVDDAIRSGYCTISFLPEDDRGIVFYHVTGHINNQPNFLGTALSYDWVRGVGAFQPSYLPIWEGVELAWPHGTVDIQNVAHVASTENSPEDQLWQRVAYSRAVPDRFFEDWNWNNQPIEIDVTGVISSDVSASPQSERVAIAWHHNRIGEELDFWDEYRGAWQRNNDIRYIISEDGENWDWDDGIQSMTQIIPPDRDLLENDPERAWGDTLRPYCDVDVEFDPWEDGDNLYGVFAASGFKEHPLGDDAEEPVFSYAVHGHLWFWSSETDEITMIYDGWYSNYMENENAPDDRNFRPGVWRLNADRGSIVFDPDEPGDIYVVWCWSRPIMEFDEDEEEWIFLENAQDTTESGYVNKEIMISASTDFGRTWHVPVNVTETIWEGDEAPEPGESMSEDWVSASPLVDDGAIHMMYILDTDGGGIAQEEGIATNSPVIYHSVDIDLLNVDELDLVELPREGFGFHNLPPEEEPEERDLDVAFRAGWNLISINVVPAEELYANNEDRGPDIILMTEQMRIDEDEHNILILKNELGQFYSPAWEFNNIPYWDLTEGYFVNVIEETETTWAGEVIPFDEDIPIAAGWNIIAYFPTYRLSARAPNFPVLAPIIDNVRIAKNGLGQFLSTEWEFSNMPDWRESQGYLINVFDDCVLNYPEDDNRFNLEEPEIDLEGEIYPTIANMSVLVTGLTGLSTTENDLVRVYNSRGIKVGTGRFELDGRCGIAVWGDDISTEKVDGLQPGEVFEIRFRDVSESVETKLETSLIHEGKGLVYTDNDFLVVEMKAAAQVPDEYYLSECYPNPFNNQTRISFGLPETANVNIGIYDVNGRHVIEIVNGRLSAGQHTMNWDASESSAGIYMIRMNAGGLTRSTKVMLLK